ncbi:MAG: translation initiation factor IF-2 N-terminal domain-containing protein, partial [Methylobacteriaceae bacterium]|nr:translation initiation factor IF-2 N-terminal domain-containing protein [Methylobacteriaceae bacterium]
MNDTIDQGDSKKAPLPPKTLTIKRPVEQGVVRQSFSHGRSKAVVVETVKRRVFTPGTSPQPSHSGRDGESVADGGSQSDRGLRARDGNAGQRRGRTGAGFGHSQTSVQDLSDHERDARLNALVDAKRREEEERARREREEAELARRKAEEQARAPEPEQPVTAAEPQEAVVAETPADEAVKPVEPVTVVESQPASPAKEERESKGRGRPQKGADAAPASRGRDRDDESAGQGRARSGAYAQKRGGTQGEAADARSPRAGNRSAYEGRRPPSLNHLARPVLPTEAPGEPEVTKITKKIQPQKISGKMLAELLDNEEGTGKGSRKAMLNAKTNVAVKVPKSTGGEERRRGRLTVNNAMASDGEEERTRSVAAFRRRQQRLAGQRSVQQKEKITREVVIPEAITIQELANRMAERGVDVIKLLMKQGEMHKITDVIDADTAQLVAEELGHTVKRVAESDVEEGLFDAPDADEDMVPRPPVVTVMGHVDHG